MIDAASSRSDDYEVIVIGAGITGIDALRRLHEAGFSVRALEAGGGVGGTWFWNRYPAAALDSESYTYGYFFSPELQKEWRWSAHFAGQPEIERYLNHVVDKYELRRHIDFNSFVERLEFDAASNSWTVGIRGGTTIRAHYVITAAGILSVPFYPQIEGRADFTGEQYHTGEWPSHQIDFVGKRVAIIGSGSSGVQMIPAIAGTVESLTVYQRTANWVLPLNNAELTPEEFDEISATFDELSKRLKSTFYGFMHSYLDVKALDVSREERLVQYEKIWNSRGHCALAGNYPDTFTDPAANLEFSNFLADKIRAIVDDPVTAEALIPKDHGFAMKRPPLGTNYFETFNKSNVTLVNLRETPLVRLTPKGIETTVDHREHDMIVWATGFDAVTGALTRIDIVGEDGTILRDAWGDGPLTYLGMASTGFPNLFFAGGPHGTQGNIPRSTEMHVEFLTSLLIHARAERIERVEAGEEAVQRWTDHVYEGNSGILMAESNWALGSNIPGKPRRPMMYRAGLPHYRANLTRIVSEGYEGFRLTPA